MSSAAFYKWRAKYGGMDASLMKRMKELEDENRRLKKMYAETKLEAEIVKEALAKNGKAISSQGDGQDRSYAGWRVGTPGLSCILYQRDLLSLSGQAFERQRTDCRLVTPIDDDQSNLGFRVVLFVPAQCEGLPPTIINVYTAYTGSLS